MGSPGHVTSLRRSFERARALGAAEQVQECCDQLCHPELLVAEVVDAWQTMVSCFDADDAGAVLEEDPEAGPTCTLVEDFFYETRELVVVGRPLSFTTLATNVNPLASTRSRTPLSTGLDYVGLTCDTEAALVLGAVKSPGDPTAYPLLLRLLACLTEMAPPAQLERMNRDVLKGVAGDAPVFDLNLVLWDRNDTPEHTPIDQLSHDLAEKLKQGLAASPDFPAVLRDIVCLRMNPDRFVGRLLFDWHA